MVSTATVEEAEDVTEAASVVGVSVLVTDMDGGVCDNDVAEAEALYATVLPAVKPSGSVIPS